MLSYLFFALILTAVLVYMISWMLVAKGIRRNLLLVGMAGVERVGRIRHKSGGEEIRPCDYIFLIHYENGRTRRVVEPSDSRFAHQLMELAAYRINKRPADSMNLSVCFV